MFDYIPRDILATIMVDMPIKVVGRTADLSPGELLVGMMAGEVPPGYRVISTVTDYGRAYNAHTAGNDDGIIANERDRMSTGTHQALNLVNARGVLCDAIVLHVARNGFTILSMWKINN